MEVPDVKIRNTAKDLTIGIGGHLIKDVTGNSHKGLVKKVRLEQIQDWSVSLGYSRRMHQITEYYFMYFIIKSKFSMFHYIADPVNP